MTMPNNNMTKQQIQQMVIRIAREEGVDPAIALAIVEQESNFNPNARNTKGENSYGLMQINRNAHPQYNPNSTPEENVRYGLRFYKQLLNQTGGNVQEALAAYNGGYGGRNGEQAQNYSRRAMNRIAKFRGNNNAVASSNQGQTTGAAASVSQPAAASIPSAQTAPVINPQVGQLAGQFAPTTSAEDLANLYSSAAANDMALVQQANQALQQATQYSDTPIGTVRGANGEEIAVTPRSTEQMRNQQIMAQNEAIRNQYVNTLDPNSQANQVFNQAMYDRLQDAYGRAAQAYEAMNPTGYNVNPMTLQNAINFDTLNPNSNAAQNYLRNRQLAYEAQIANANGIPYDRFIAMKNAQALLAAQEAQQINALNQRISQDRATTAGNLQNMYGYDTNVTQRQLMLNAAQRQFDANLAAQVGEQQAALIKQQMVNNGTYANAVMDYQQAMDVARTNAQADILTTGMTNQTNRAIADTQAGTDLARTNLAGQYGLQEQELRNQGSMDVTRLQQQDPNKALSSYGAFMGNMAFLSPQQSQQFINAMPSNLSQGLFPRFQQAYGTMQEQRANDPNFTTRPNYTLNINPFGSLNR